MKNKVKLYLISCIMTILLISPTVLSVTENAIPTKEADIGSVKVYDSLTNDIEQHTIKNSELETILTIINEPIDPSSYEHQIQEKLSMLVSLNLISAESAKNAFQCFEYQKTLSLNDIGSSQSQPILFDAMNLFNGIFFGLKGNLQNTVMYLPVFQFPFFDDNITALFIGYSKAVGSGSVFTLGTLGFKYIYDFDKDAYDFPYFSPVTGNLIGFTGIIIEVSVGNLLPEYQGNYLIGVGMSIFTLWNKEG